MTKSPLKTSLSLKKRIGRRVSEYYLGKRTRDYFNYERRFYKECISCKPGFESYFIHSKKEEQKYLFFGKWLPFALQGGGLVASLITKNNAWGISGIIAGEFLRMGVACLNPVPYRRIDQLMDIEDLYTGQSLEEYAFELTEMEEGDFGEDGLN